MKLNLGSGKNPKGDWINIDNDPNAKYDILRDITKGLPFADNSMDEVYASHIMEHLTKDEFCFVMQEIWRVCIDKAKITIIVPHWQYEGAYDIDHKPVITKRWFKIFEKGYSCVQDTHKFHQGCYFKINEIIEDVDGSIKHAEPQMYVYLEVEK